MTTLAPRRQRARVVLFCFLASLLSPAAAQSAAPGKPQRPVPLPPPPLAADAGPAAPGKEDAVEPKLGFIWGMLLNMAVKAAMSAFTSWLTSKITASLADSGALQRILLNSKQATILPLGEAAPQTFGARSAGAVENAVAGEPVKPLQVDNGRENYQGVHVAIVGFDLKRKYTGIKPVSAGFRTGDQIKLKVLPTYAGLLVIENVNPKGERKQVYPPKPGDVVALKAGVEVMVPLAGDQYFEFAGATGEDQLVITLRDPRAFGPAESKAPANRKDDEAGSSFVQETPTGTFPVISQALRLRHGG